ncbi:restriction endonuclease subunit S [Thomasclavelia ramosa]|uniref:restriction endonuclease subunit S n=1 Tax=Thomasclavelia ramosa TaxID=1547 RepID=UPI0020CACB47|nr:restriction endonuclease subunit S [Thomasclavelia ramosa]
MKCKLLDICSFRKGKMDIENLNTKNYISTENMLPNKCGITDASSLPTVSLVQEYKKGDVLVSNIRPYFKKIWQAKYNGGCSNDVLVFVPKSNTDRNFLYYVLANDDFFTYSMATSKGTKMPRGDKTSIMQYEVPMFDLNAQNKVASILKSLDEKIELNNAINNNLEQQAFAIFDNIFPDVSSGNNLIGNIITPQRGKNLLSKDAIPGEVPVVAGGLEPATYHNKPNTTSPVLTISASGANAGYVNLWNVPVWSSDSSYIDASMTDNVYFLYVMLKKRQQEIFDAQTGSAQPHIYPKHIAAMPVIDLEPNEIVQFTKLVTPLFQAIGINKQENIKLAEIRDSLLPKLMSGELDVSDINI